MFDERRANEITINCQLFATDLLDKLEEGLGEQLDLIQVNTDGIIVLLKDKSLYPKYLEICKEWEERTKFKLEHDMIKRIIQKDVNNYLALFENGQLERKGSYVKDKSPIDNDLPIVTKAVVDYLMYDIPVEKTINECDDLIQFQLCCKVGSTYDEVRYGDKPINTKVNRVFATTKDLPMLFKVKKNFENKKGEIADKIEKVANVPEHCWINNDSVINVKCPEHIDKQWYIDMAIKRIKDFGIKI